MYPDRRQENRRVALTVSVLASVLPCVAGTAHGQTSANLTLLSEYSARGVALDTRPTLQLRVVHDTAAGWYGGGFASRVRLEQGSQAQLTAYAGRARQLGSTLSVDVGVSHTTFSRDSHFNYSEFYAGMTLGRGSARLFYSPSYYGEGRTLYLDLNGAYPLGEKVSLSLHGGLLHPLGNYDNARNSGDVRVALATELGDYRFQVGWQAKWRPYLQGVPPARAFVASASLYF